VRSQPAEADSGYSIAPEFDLLKDARSHPFLRRGTVAALACGIPGLAAARVHPVEALSAS
jgi:hypothetical protein